jgi:hypothetical protein
MEQFELNRRHLMQGSLGMLAGLASTITDLDAQASSEVDTELFKEITAVLDKTAELFNSQQSVMELWDRDDTQPYYIAEEIREPIVGWDALNAYMHPARKRMLDTFRWGYSNLRARFDRVLAIYRKRPEGWKQILYAQCPYGPYDYVQALRERAVSPDFEEFRARSKEAAKD